jgi:hypothetical protein
MPSRRRTRLRGAIVAGLVVIGGATAGNAGLSTSSVGAGKKDLTGKRLSVQFQIYDREDHSSYVFVTRPGGTIFGFERHRTPGDGLGGVFSVVSTATTAVCNHSRQLCRILTGENEL